MTFGAMFHHFHDTGIHRRSQGSISAATFEGLLDDLAARFDLLPAVEYLERSRRGCLEERDTCITMDDALLSQYEIAAPLLDARGIGGFFFIYSSIFTDQPDALEIYRDFRHACFEDIEAFYQAFFRRLAEDLPRRYTAYLDTYPEDYLGEYSFYTDNDCRFRYARDHVLDEAEYAGLMDAMMAAADYPKLQRQRELWMTAGQVADLHRRGHVIGLHSHSHPMRMAALSWADQAGEFEVNRRMLTEICGQTPVTMSHPCGSYNDDTLDVLREMGIELGFRSNMSAAHGGSRLELPREDHMILLGAVA